MTDSKNKYSNPNAVDRVTSLPLFSTTLRLVASAYIDVKSFHPLMSSVFSIAEKGVKTMTQVATEQATPLLERLEPQITAVNIYACDGLSQLEEKYPVLNQTADELAGHLKSAFYITLDNLQDQLNSKIDSALVQTNTALETTKTTVISRVNTLLGSRFGKALVLGLDSVLTLSEELVDYYLPATEEELKHLSLMSSRNFVVTEEDEDEGPYLQDRVQSLIVRMHLRMFHQGVLIWKELKQLGLLLRYYTGQMDSSQLFNALHALAFRILRMYAALINKVQSQQQLALLQLSSLIQALASLWPLHPVLSLAGEAQAFLALVVSDLYNLSMILLQLLINTTPLYDLASFTVLRWEVGNRTLTTASGTQLSIILRFGLIAWQELYSLFLGFKEASETDQLLRRESVALT
ncbi:perilipin 6 [Erpetoichthys calabaricus]|uniref:perilipin 6 n=1 Tax=Erpetoichthys calabaricus TaxID=27687 RepID=UPI002234C81D|nr:perilipin 6 [Erpetoichthys calabaricus]